MLSHNACLFGLLETRVRSNNSNEVERIMGQLGSLLITIARLIVEGYELGRILRLWSLLL